MKPGRLRERRTTVVLVSWPMLQLIAVRRLRPKFKVFGAWREPADGRRGYLLSVLYLGFNVGPIATVPRPVRSALDRLYLRGKRTRQPREHIG